MNIPELLQTAGKIQKYAREQLNLTAQQFYATSWILALVGTNEGKEFQVFMSYMSIKQKLLEHGLITKD